MKRAGLSIILGTALPFVYAIVSGLISTLLENSTIKTVLNMPVGWPRFLYFYLTAQLGDRAPIENEILFFAVVVASNVFVYSLLTYVTLSVLSFKLRKVERAMPPHPPEFFEN